MIVDLSVSLSANTPTYPGDPKITIQQSATYGSEGYLGHSIQMGTHAGTHIDAPAHMIEGSPSLGEIPLETFVGNGKIVHDFSLENLEAADIMPGDIVLFDTGTAERFYDPSYFTDFPVMAGVVAEYLVQRKVKLVGIDTCSADNDAGFPVHKALLAAGIPIVENLTNLSALHGKPFKFYALPLKFDLDGAPVRAFAEVHDA